MKEFISSVKNFMFNDQLFDDTVGSVANAEATLFGSSGAEGSAYVSTSGGVSLAAGSVAVGSETTLTVDGVASHISVVGANVEIAGGSFTDYITIGGAASNVKINTGSGADSVIATSGSGAISLGADNDYITISSGTYTVNAGAGNDSIYVGTDGSVYIDGLDGLDTIEGFGSGVTINAGSDATVGSTDDGITISDGTNTILLTGSLDASSISNSDGVFTYGADNDTTPGSSGSSTVTSGSEATKVVADESVGAVSVGSDTELTGSGTADALGFSLSGSAESYTVEELVGSTTSLTLNENGELVVASGSDTAASADSIAEVELELGSDGLLSMSVTGGSNADDDARLNFAGGTSVSKVTADFTNSTGNFAVGVTNLKTGVLKFSEESNLNVTFDGLLAGAQISMTGGANDNNPDSGNTYYAIAGSGVTSSADQAVVTITDISFNATDVVKVGVGVASLTADFFDTGKFYNYASVEDASTSSVYASTVFDASERVAEAGMSFSMLRMADGSAAVDDENAVDESDIVNVVWANTGSAATIDFAGQTDSILLFTNTNGTYGDAVTLGGDYDDTIHVGANDTILAGDGNDSIIVEDGAAGKNAYIDTGAGNDTVYAGRGTHIVFDDTESGDDVVLNFTAGTNSKAGVIEIAGSSIPEASLNGGALVLSSENGTISIAGSESFTGSTDFAINYNGTDGVLRVADSNGNVTYDKDVTYYAGTDSTLLLGASRATTVNLSDTTYENIANVNAGSATGKVVISGDSGDNAIYGGKNASTLWGGGGNDTLYGGAGKDTFLYTGEGNVTIMNGDSADVVDLTAFEYDEDAVAFTSNGLVITTSDDQTLTINGTNMTTFNFSNGTYTADYANGSFVH